MLVARDAMVRAERLRRLSIVERRFEPLPINAAVARSYGQLASTIARAGRQARPRVMDLVIAATAHACGVRLYTANPVDLRGLEAQLDIVAVTTRPKKRRPR